MRLGFAARLLLASSVLLFNLSCVASRLQAQTPVPILTVQADAQSKTYGAPDPVFTYTWQGFTGGDTASSLSGQPAVNAPQRVQNLWQFTESLPSSLERFWQFSSDGTSQGSHGIQLTHITSGGNFYSSVSGTLAGLPATVVVPGMQYLLSFYAVSNIPSYQVYWHRYLTNGNANGWGQTAIDQKVRRVVFQCGGTASGALDCGDDPTVPLGSGPGQTDIYWLFLAKNNTLSGDPSLPGFQVSVPADLYIGGMQMEPGVTEKRGAVAMGDSLTQDNCSTNDRQNCSSWTAVAASQLDIPFYNRAIAGETCDQILARWPNDASPILAANAKYAIIFCGTNDLSAQSSAGQIEQSISAMSAFALADGATPVVATIPPFVTTVTTAEPTRQAVNAWIRATYALVLDFDHVVADPNNPTQQNPAYAGDGTHLNFAGRLAEGNYVAQSIAGNTNGYPQVWDFHAPTTYQPVLGQNPSNGMDFHPGTQRETGSYIILPAVGTLTSAKYQFAFNSAMLTVTPAPLSVAANNKTMSYGSPLPVLDGTITGALAADNISAAYTTTATSLSAPGTYPIVPNLVDPGNRVSNYNVTLNPGTLTITSPLITTLSPPFASAGTTAFTLTLNGSGFTPASVVHWAGTSLATQFVSPTSLSAQVPSSDVATSGPAAITVQDSVTTSNTLDFETDSSNASGYAPVFNPSTATISAGGSATFSVTLPATASSASVSCLNLPANATCAYSFNSHTLTITTASSTPPGSYQLVVVFTETVTTTASAWVAFPLLVLPFVRIRKRRGRRCFLALSAVVLSFAAGLILAGCGGGQSSATPPPVTQQVISSGAVVLTVH